MPDRHVLPGLEFLIELEIIDTLMKPSLHDLVELGAIVLVRIFTSFSLNAELKPDQQNSKQRDRLRTFNPAWNLSGLRVCVRRPVRFVGRQKN